jgi:hypothetical protein
MTLFRRQRLSGQAGKIARIDQRAVIAARI